MIFVDTSAFFALADEEDDRHSEAIVKAEVWLAGQEELVTHNYILAETFALMSRRLGFESVRAFYRDVHRLCKVLWVSQSQHERSAKVFVQQTSPRYSFVDCVSFEIMKAHRIGRFFAFDEDFQKAGFEPA
jgi:uncharacterized protein